MVTYRGMHGRSWSLVGLAVAALTACNYDQKEREKGLEAYAKTWLDHQPVVGQEPKLSPEEEKRLAELERAKAAKDAAETQRIEETFARLIVAPEPAPKSLKVACDQLLDAYHAFKLKTHADDERAIMDWYGEKKLALGKLRAKCVEIGNIAAVSCQTHALSEAPADFGDKEVELLRSCVDKYAPQAVAAGQVPEAR